METADLILKNGKIYTSDKGLPWAKALAIKDSTFIYVGNDDQWEAYVGESSKIVDLHGKMVIPGLIDSHTHPSEIAKTMWRCNFQPVKSLNDLLTRIKEYCQEHTKEETPYLFAESYDVEWFGKNGPDKILLDQYVSDRPVRVQDFTDHACWYNSKALELMGIDKDTPNPKGGMGKDIEFIRDENGEPTGWVLEPIPPDYERPMYKKIGWAPPLRAAEETVMPFLEFLNSCGIIYVMEAITDDEETMKLYYDLDLAGKLNLYYEGACLLPDYSTLNETIEACKMWQKKYTSKHVCIRAIKFFLDGTNELGDMASLEPFKNDPSGKNYGAINMSEEELTKVLLRLNEENLDLHLHMVCDRAFRTACNAIEQAKRIAKDSWNMYVTFAHCELIHPDDMKRVKDLGIIINWTPQWSGGYFGESAIKYLGKARWETMYDFTKILQYGGLVCYSSDVFSYSEVGRADPFLGMECGNTRIDLNVPLPAEKYPGSVRPPQSAKLSIDELLRGYTISGAAAFRTEDRLGSIQIGKEAHLSILSNNLFDVNPSKLHKVKPVCVIFEGRTIYTAGQCASVNPII